MVVSQLKNTLAILFLPISDSIEANPIVVCSASIDEEVEKDSDIEDTDNEKPYSNKEIITDIAMGLGHSAMAGVGAAGGLIGIPPAIVEIANGSACFIDAAKKIMKMSDLKMKKSPTLMRKMIVIEHMITILGIGSISNE